MIYIAFLIVTVIVLFFVWHQVQYFIVFSPTYYPQRSTCSSCIPLAIHTQDGVELEGIEYTPQQTPHTTVLFFGGKSQDSVALIERLSTSYPHMRIVTFNYRGYGKSEGTPSEAKLLEDSAEIAKMVQKHYGDFYIFGFSLGSSVGAYAASQVQSRGVVLLGAFDSIADLAYTRFGVKLPSFLVRYRFETKVFVQNITQAVALLVSKDDTITCIQNARNLKNFIPHLWVYKEYEGIGHKDLLFDTDVVQEVKNLIKG